MSSSAWWPKKDVEVPDYTDIRKMYVKARSGYGTTQLGQIDKASAHAEFNAFVQQERDKAAQAARLEGLREGWRQGSWHVFAAMGGNLNTSRLMTTPTIFLRRQYEQPSTG